MAAGGAKKRGRGRLIPLISVAVEVAVPCCQPVVGVAVPHVGTV
jgi:hypothetical protein